MGHAAVLCAYILDGPYLWKDGYDAIESRPLDGACATCRFVHRAHQSIPTMPLAESYLGGRGLAARLAWDLIPPGIGALDPRNPLMFMVGALVGTPAPSSGRDHRLGLSSAGVPG